MYTMLFTSFVELNDAIYLFTQSHEKYDFI